MKEFDILIIGAGPGGLASAIYGLRGGFKVGVVERGAVGGQVALTDVVENYPGFPEPISGQELMARMEKQALRFGMVLINDEITEVSRGGDKYIYAQGYDEKYKSKALIIATGSDPKKLNVPGEKEFLGRGVSYCAICDGHFFREKPVAVIGGGDSAKTEAIYLSNIASQVYLIHRRDTFRGEKILEQRVKANPKIKPILNTVVERIEGEDFVKGLELRNVITGEKSFLDVRGIFIYIGLKPNTEFLKGFVELDETGHIITDEFMRTNIPGVFAAGDVRRGSFRQITNAVSDGTIAALLAGEYIEKEFKQT